MELRFIKHLELLVLCVCAAHLFDVLTSAAPPLCAVYCDRRRVELQLPAGVELLFTACRTSAMLQMFQQTEHLQV